MRSAQVALPEDQLMHTWVDLVLERFDSSESMLRGQAVHSMTDGAE
jgi:hypothetical protein